MQIILGYILTYAYLIFVLMGVSLLQKKLNLKTEISRKLIHILVGFSWFIMAYFFKSSWHLIIPPLSFIVINYISYKRNLIASMQRKDSKGTIYYAISFTILASISVLKSEFLPFYGIGVLSMSLGDGLAPFIGTKFNKYKMGMSNKTYSGSITIFVCTMIVISSFSLFYNLELGSIKIILLSLISVILELFGNKYDNLTLPIGLSIFTYLVRSI